MKRVYRWLAWMVGVPVVAFALLVAAAFWQVQLREADAARKFAALPPGERQLAIFDAFARLVESNYYDAAFIERDWPALRTRWREEAARTRNDFDVYFKVLMQLNLNFPSSHLSARPPASPVAATQRQQESGSSAAPPGRSGITFALLRRGKGMVGLVDSVAVDSPAALAGVEPGWQVLSYSSCRVGERTTSRFLAFGTPADRLAWESTGSVTLHDSGMKTIADFERRYQHSVDYTCDAQPQVVAFETRDIDGVTYLRLDTFTEARLIDAALAALDGATSRGVILDLRSNGGGLRDQQLRLISRLLPDGTLVGTEFTRGARTEMRAAGGVETSWPLIVLIGPSTGSAAEVTAAALQDHHRARLLGRSTAGATLVSGHFALPDGGDAQIPMSDFLRPGGRRIEAVGVMPDVPVMPTNADARAGRDPALERALLELRSTQTTAATGSRSPAG